MKKKILVYLLSSCLALTSFGQVNYQWVKSVGSSVGEGATDVTVDNHGYSYIVGKRGGETIDFNIYGNPGWELTNSATSCFVAKYDSTGNCVWAKDLHPIGSIGFSIASSVAVDATGSVYIGGSFIGKVDFDPSLTGTKIDSSAVDIQGAYSFDAFILKLDSGGNYEWESKVGGKGLDVITSLIVDPAGATIYVSGTFNSDTAVFTTVADTLFNKGEIDGFVAGIETSTGFTSWKNVVGGIGNDAITDIDASSDYLVVTGFFNDSVVFYDESVISGTLYAEGGEGLNAFYGKYTLPGGGFGWMNKIGGAGSTSLGTGVAFKNNSEIYLTGGFNGTIEVDPSNSSTILVSDGGKDVFFCKYSIGGVYDWAKRIGSENSNFNNTVVSRSISVDANENTYIVGYFSGVIDFNASGTTDYPDTSETGGSDFYFAKYDNVGEIVWSKKIASELIDTLVSIAVDDKFDIYLAGGYTDTIDFNPSAGVAKRSSLGNEDLFLAKYAQGMATIKGTVTYGTNNDTINIGTDNKVRLYTQILFDGNMAMNLIAETTIDNNGHYIFNTVPDGEYLALAVPGSNYTSIVASTYYSASTSFAVQWEDADTISAVSISPAFVANIKMLKYPALALGTGVLSGQVLQGNGFDRIGNGPVGGTDVGLDGVPGGRLATTQTDANGNYQFNNIPPGCYRIYVNVTCLPMDSTYNRCLDSTEAFVNLDFFADSNSIYIDRTITGVEHNTKNGIGFIAYPNPYNNSFVMEYTLMDATNVTLEIYNMVGEKMMEFSNTYPGAGIYKQVINTYEKGLKGGIYLMNVRLGNEVTTKRIIQLN